MQEETRNVLSHQRKTAILSVSLLKIDRFIQEQALTLIVSGLVFNDFSLLRLYLLNEQDDLRHKGYKKESSLALAKKQIAKAPKPIEPLVI